MHLIRLDCLCFEYSSGPCKPTLRAESPPSCCTAATHQERWSDGHVAKPSDVQLSFTSCHLHQECGPMLLRFCMTLYDPSEPRRPKVVAMSSSVPHGPEPARSFGFPGMCTRTKKPTWRSLEISLYPHLLLLHACPKKLGTLHALKKALPEETPSTRCRLSLCACLRERRLSGMTLTWDGRYTQLSSKQWKRDPSLARIRLSPAGAQIVAHRGGESEASEASSMEASCSCFCFGKICSGEM